VKPKKVSSLIRNHCLVEEAQAGQNENLEELALGPVNERYDQVQSSSRAHLKKLYLRESSNIRGLVNVRENTQTRRAASMVAVAAGAEALAAEAAQTIISHSL
jgi:hypothetical protein